MSNLLRSSQQYYGKKLRPNMCFQKGKGNKYITQIQYIPTRKLFRLYHSDRTTSYSDYDDIDSNPLRRGSNEYCKKIKDNIMGICCGPLSSIV